MAEIKVINNLTNNIEDVPTINVSMSNAIYRGEPGDPGVWVGENEPTNSSLIWINPIKGNVLQIRNEVGDSWKEVPYISLDRETFATKDYVADEIEKIPQPDLSKYALKSEIPSTSGLATEKYVDDAIANIDVPEMDVEGLSKIFILNLGSVGTSITTEQKTIIENIYNNPNSLIYVNGMLIDHVEKGDTHLRLYYIRWDGSRTSMMFKFNGGKITSSTVPSFSNILLSADEVEVDRGFVPSGLKQSVNNEFGYIKNNYYTKTEIDDLIPDISGFVSEDRVLELIEEHGGGNLPASEEGEF